MKLCFKKEQDGKQKKEILQLSRDMSTWSQYLDETPAPNPTPETCSADYIKAHLDLVKDPSKADLDRDKKRWNKWIFGLVVKTFFLL